MILKASECVIIPREDALALAEGIRKLCLRIEPCEAMLGHYELLADAGILALYQGLRDLGREEK